METEALSSEASATLRSSLECLVGEPARELLLDLQMILCKDCEALPVVVVLPTAVSASKLLLLYNDDTKQGL